MEQIGIALTSVLAIWFSQCKSFKIRRWASICGLVGQPFWFYTTYTHKQWGIFFLTFVYTAAWGKGFYHHWLDKNYEHDHQSTAGANDSVVRR